MILRCEKIADGGIEMPLHGGNLVLNPRVRQSGLSAVHHDRISKSGRSHAGRSLLGGGEGAP